MDSHVDLFYRHKQNKWSFTSFPWNWLFPVLCIYFQTFFDRIFIIIIFKKIQIWLFILFWGPISITVIFTSCSLSTQFFLSWFFSKHGKTLPEKPVIFILFAKSYVKSSDRRDKFMQNSNFSPTRKTFCVLRKVKIGINIWGERWVVQQEERSAKCSEFPCGLPSSTEAGSF